MAQTPGAHQPGMTILTGPQGIAVRGKSVLLVVHYHRRAAATGEPPQRIDRAQGMLILLLNLLDHCIEQPDGVAGACHHAVELGT